MDPNEALRLLLEAIKDIQDVHGKPENYTDAHCDRLKPDAAHEMAEAGLWAAEQVLALHQWFEKGGALPDAWSKAGSK
jgi:hypothetical protein